MILAGYEIGSGKPVHIPVTHMAITGQTQRSGKTTAMEALAERSGFRSVAFLTKRGESAFQFGHEVPPYFEERADWKFVKDLFEQITGYSQNDKEAEIIRLCQGAKSLETVWRRVQRQLGIDPDAPAAKAKPRLSKRADDMYIRMNAYFEEIMPKLCMVPRSKRLELRRGMNVIDLRPYEQSIQQLLLTNAFQWVYENEERVIFIVPEAWYFLSEERGSITRTAGREFIRRSAALQNFLWADCQDIRGLDKTILGQMGVWLVGNQRELNEVARTIKSFVSDPQPPTVTDIMTLGIGEFYVLHGPESHRTYVQPVWADAHTCALYAKDRDPAGRPRRALPKMPPPPKRNDIPADEKPNARENANGPEITASSAGTTFPAHSLPGSIPRQSAGGAESPGHASPAVPGEHSRGAANPQRYSLESPPIEIAQLRAEVSRLRNEVRMLSAALNSTLKYEGSAMPKTETTGKTTATRDLPELEQIWQFIKRRALQDPDVLAVLAAKPEIRVTIARPIIETDGNTLRGRLALLIQRDFFREPVSASRAYDELVRTWRNVGKPNVYKECDALTELGFLTKEDDGYQAVPGMKISLIEAAK